ncbi:hypothetical protein IFM89_016812 [Coptis chinensis]|uniref:Uncharacterized protein n=1 Tax=Coptis chinensis TaxID=261450 RepID=A0A835IZ96_9MAGN|nr:hypothetical protein IFM89_016812 [Coptis chinensis]
MKKFGTRLYPAEPYELDLSSHLSDIILENLSECTSYDFLLAVSKPIMNEDVFLEEAVARYKGSYEEINKERSIKRFCVPTYDIDVIWHSHQLHPVSYCKDLVEVLGEILEHDDNG